MVLQLNGVINSGTVWRKRTLRLVISSKLLRPSISLTLCSMMINLMTTTILKLVKMMKWRLAVK